MLHLQAKNKGERKQRISEMDIFQIFDLNYTL